MKKMFNFLSFFRRNKSPEEINLPDRIEISFTNEALEKGVLDDFNKQIKRYKNGVIVEKVEYSIHRVRAMAKTYLLPILDLTKKKDEDYEFEEVTALYGEIRRIIKV